MSVASMIDAIVVGFRAGVPSLKNVLPHDGQFGERDLARFTNEAPCVYVSCVGFSDSDDQGDDMVMTGQWVAAIVTKRTTGEQGKASRIDAATAIAEAILPIIRDSNGSNGAWSGVSNSGPSRIRARNLFSPELDAKALTLWLVTWEQDVSVIDFDAIELDNLITLQSTFDDGTETDVEVAITTTVAGAA